MALITGNTYKVKDALKALGGRWHADVKGWEVPEEKMAEAQALVDNATYTGGVWSSTYPRTAPRTCQTCGCRINYGRYCGRCEYTR